MLAGLATVSAGVALASEPAYGLIVLGLGITCLGFLLTPVGEQRPAKIGNRP